MNTRKSFGKARHYLMIFLILAMSISSVPIQAQDDDGSSTQIFLPIVQSAGDDTNNQEGGEVSAAIVGGNNASQTYTWMVNVNMYNPPQAAMGCGGSLIHPRWVLSAGHCYNDPNFLDPNNPGEIWSHVGIYDLANTTNSEAISATNVIVGSEGDIALIKLKSASTKTPVELADEAFMSTNIAVSTPITLLGWGNTSTSMDPNSAIYPTVLQELQNPVVDWQTCMDFAVSVGWDTQEGELFFCTGDLNTIEGTYNGDSGSPSVLGNTQVGVASGGGYQESVGDSYNTFARVASHLEWIKHEVSREAGATLHVSRSTGGAYGNSASLYPSVSGNGQHVAFHTLATNLLSPADNNGKYDVYLRNRETDTTLLVSRTPGGSPGNHNSTTPSISADGRYIAYQSDASNILPNGVDSNGVRDIYRFDSDVVTTTLVSVADNESLANGGSSSASISGDGTKVVFSSGATNLDPTVTDNNSKTDIYVRDIADGSTELVSWNNASNGVGNGTSTNPVISVDGRYVAFQSTSTNMLAACSNGKTHIFVRDLEEDITVCVSKSSSHVQGNDSSHGPSISENGDVVTFFSYATNLAGTDTNARTDVFVHNLTGTPQTIRISNKADGSASNGNSSNPSISDDGRYIAFNSEAKLTPDDVNGGVGAPYTDVYVYDRVSGIISLASVNSEEAGGNALSAMEVGSMSGDGCVVGFVTTATNLAGDTNGVADIYVRTNTCARSLSDIP